MTKGNIHGRLNRLEARTPAPASSPGAQAKMLDSLDRIAAWRRAGCPDEEEGRYLKALDEAIKRRLSEVGGGMIPIG